MDLNHSKVPMRKTQSLPNLYGSSPVAKHGSYMRCNAYSANNVTDINTLSESRLIERFDNLVTSSVHQKLTCIEQYGFPKEILNDPTLSMHDKKEKITDLATCIIMPEEAPNESPRSAVPRVLPNELERITAIEERFHRLLLSIRKTRRSASVPRITIQ